MEIINFTVQKRETTGKDLADLRAQGFIPGVVYGPELKENVLIQLRQVEADKLYRSAGESSLINLQVEGGAAMDVLIKDVSHDPLTLVVDHIDFYKIKAGEKIEAKVKLNFIGESSLLKAGGTLVTSFDEVEIRCLPKDLVGEIKVDLTALKEFGDTIYVKDLPVPEGVEILEHADDAVASISAPQAEEVFATATPTEVMPEVIGEKKEDGEAAAATSAAPAKDEKKK